MEITVDSFGRILLPQALRKHIGIRPGSVLEVGEDHNKIILKPKEEGGAITIKEQLAVYSGEIEDPEDAIKKIRDGRAKKLSGIL